MAETLTLLFSKRENGTFELQVTDSWSRRTVSASFVPPYTTRQISNLQKKLNRLESTYKELREIGQRLFLALCGSEMPGTTRQDAAEQSVQAVLRSVIMRTLKRRGTVALTCCFAPGCEEFVRYPWELLHNGDHFLIVAGIFTLTRALLRPDMPTGCELPVRPPLRMLYIGASPIDWAPLETERSFESLERALLPLIETGQVFLDRLEPPTFDQLVRYLSSYGGAGLLDDSETAIPCYVVHFDGHGAYGRLCPDDACETVNEPGARTCIACGTTLDRNKPQTYLCFCDEQGRNQFIDAQTLRELFLSSDVRLAVFSACETATIDRVDELQRQSAVDATLATALVMAQVPAVVAMPFSLQDDLSPTFMYHFYEALADGRMLEEALARARQALLPRLQKSWFIPVLYRHVTEGRIGPVPLLAGEDTQEEQDHPLAHLDIPQTFVGRKQELADLDALLTAAAMGKEHVGMPSRLRLRAGTHLIGLTGPAGIGKSALAFEAVRRNYSKFAGGVIGISLQGGKSFSDALAEMVHHLHISTRAVPKTDQSHYARLVLSTLRALASRELPCLLLVDSFEEVKERNELENWLQFLCALPPEVVAIVTSRANPETFMIGESLHCRWYEYRVGKMTDVDLLTLFSELACASGLDQSIHMDEPRQQIVLREICTLLDGYPLGAELIFGTARSINGKLYTPEAATRSLEEVRDELQNTPLAGILAVLDVAFKRLTPLARLLLAYLAAFKLPFSREQILVLVNAESSSSVRRSVRLVLKRHHDDRYATQEHASLEEEVYPIHLTEHWRAARDELVQASFIQFDGRVYTIHPQVRHFALSHLPIEELHRVHRVVAAYYYSLPQPSAEEWVAAFEHLESAGEPADIQEAVRLAVRASWALYRRGHAQELLAILRRAGVHASRIGDKSGEGQIQCCIGAILRSLGQYIEAEACLKSSLAFHKQLNERWEAGWALYELAALSREEGNLQQASAYVQEALSFFREVNALKGESYMHMVAGEVSRAYASFYNALGHFELALNNFHSLQDKEGIAAALRDRGTVYEALGQYTKALKDYEEALRLFNELGLHEGQAWVLADQCVVYMDQGKLDLAEKTCNEAIAIFREYGVQRGEAWALRAMGDTVRERHDLITARTYYEQALSLFSTIGNRIDQGRVLNSLGAITFEEGAYPAARSTYEQALSIAREHGAEQIAGRALRGLGDVARALHQFVEAEHYYRSSSTIAAKLDAPAEQCAIQRRLGLLYQAQELYTKALEAWIQALAMDQRLGHPARTGLQEKVRALVEEHHLEAVYVQLCERHNVA